MERLGMEHNSPQPIKARTRTPWPMREVKSSSVIYKCWTSLS